MKQYVIASALALGLAGPVAAQVLSAQMPKDPISRADFLALNRTNFTANDTDKDGAVSKEELAATLAKQFGRNPPPDLLGKIFKPLDPNGDSKATAAEVEAHTAFRFDQWDKNRDGTLTTEEMAAGQQAMMATNEMQ